jgi:hypothetical protein
MQPVEKQIKILANKVDDVYQILDHLLVDNEDVVQSAPPVDESSYLLIDDDHDLPSSFSKNRLAESSDWLVHQDVLVDSQGMEASHHHAELHLSPQSQIQRLTAQLTVAYSRIAALEEQLLSQRLN